MSIQKMTKPHLLGLVIGLLPGLRDILLHQLSYVVTDRHILLVYPLLYCLCCLRG